MFPDTQPLFHTPAWLLDFKTSLHLISHEGQSFMQTESHELNWCVGGIYPQRNNIWIHLELCFWSCDKENMLSFSLCSSSSNQLGNEAGLWSAKCSTTFSHCIKPFRWKHLPGLVKCFDGEPRQFIFRATKPQQWAERSSKMFIELRGANEKGDTNINSLNNQHKQELK